MSILNVCLVTFQIPRMCCLPASVALLSLIAIYSISPVQRQRSIIQIQLLELLIYLFYVNLQFRPLANSQTE